MPFDDLDDDEPDSPGNEALDELAGTLSGTSDTEQTDETAGDSPVYDPETDPAFPTAKAQTQHSIYCLPETWEDVDGASGLLFEAEVLLRRDGYDNVQKRELHNALLRAAVETLTPENVVAEFIETRDDRKQTDSSLLNEGE